VIALLSTVQALPDDERAAAERALVPLARDAAIGALTVDIAHDAANALFGLTGLIGLLEAGEELEGGRIALLRQAGGELDVILRPLLELARASRDDRSTADLAAATRAAVALYSHGDRPGVATHYPDGPVRVACAPALTLQAAIHLLLAARSDRELSVAVGDGTLEVAPPGDESLDEVIARRIAADHGGSVQRSTTSFSLLLPSA
jgi:hypothetical protein